MQLLLGLSVYFIHTLNPNMVIWTLGKASTVSGTRDGEAAQAKADRLAECKAGPEARFTGFRIYGLRIF